MAIVFVAPNQDPSRVSRKLTEAAGRVGGSAVRTSTASGRVSFIVDSKTLESWKNPPKPAVKKSPARRKQPSSSGPQKMAPVEDTTGGER